MLAETTLYDLLKEVINIIKLLDMNYIFWIILIFGTMFCVYFLSVAYKTTVDVVVQKLLDHWQAKDKAMNERKDANINALTELKDTIKNLATTLENAVKNNSDLVKLIEKKQDFIEVQELMIQELRDKVDDMQNKICDIRKVS